MITCPICHKDDQIQKVTSIYDSGNRTGQYGGTATTLGYYDNQFGVAETYTSGNSRSSTFLAQKLAPPSEPKKPPFPIKFWLGIFFGISSLCLLSVTQGGGIIGIGIAICLIAWGASQRSKKMDDYYEKLKDWRFALVEWNNQYYCHRDDILFNPTNGKTWTFTRQ